MPSIFVNVSSIWILFKINSAIVNGFAGISETLNVLAHSFQTLNEL